LGRQSIPALSDIILLGTEDQVRLAERAARELVAGRTVHTHELVVSLRNFIREALDLDPIPSDLAIPMQGPARPARAIAARASGSKEKAGKVAAKAAAWEWVPAAWGWELEWVSAWVGTPMTPLHPTTILRRLPDRGMSPGKRGHAALQSPSIAASFMATPSFPSTFSLPVI